MTFDKAKSLRAAEKYLELGKIPAAIKEYTQIAANEPDDFATINTLGDLHVRVGNQPAAISCFRRIAEHYREQDFALKAIAVYKKIDRLQPRDTEIATNLADLYAKQDLVVEARAHYLAVADAHNRAGNRQDALEILRKIADLDPQNTDIRIKLAEGYLKEGVKPEAAACFTEAGQRLLTRGAFDNALEAFGRSLEIRPTDIASLKGVLAAHSARGTADEAAEAIERVVASDPDNLELLSMLASAYVAADDAPPAERAIESLVAKESSAYLRYIDVARLYLRTDKVEDAVRVVACITEQMLAEREAEQLLVLVDELLACDSDNVQALRLLVRAHWWQRDMEKLGASLERLAEAAQAAGLESDERYALTQLTRLVPEHGHHAERLEQLGGAEETAELLPEFATSNESPSETTTDQFAFQSEAVSAPVGEAEFEWNSLGEITDAGSETSAEASGAQGFTFESIVAEELPSTSEPAVEDDAESRNSDLRARELESVDFYIAQGYLDIAVDTLDLLERQFGSQPDIDIRRQRLQQASDTPIKEPAVQTETVDYEVDRTPAKGLNGSAQAPHEIAAPPHNINIEPAPAYQGIDPGLAEVFEEYRLSAESDGETGTNGDYETHYNLGLAYKEMELFEEALQEFQVAVAMVKPGDGTPRYLHCCNLLGHCFMQNGVPRLALKWFSDGLNAPGASEDERQALRYELAAAYEHVGELNRAIALFTEVYGKNVSYRGVNERLRALQQRAGESKNGKHAPGHKAAKNRKHRSK
ncbi:MAG TPA: tetratricopeptide repeat protein [Pyrinomonadaceae bacterium]|nr:tetratricopeptide repeat protein [Pyrinomonadaceae bacterium]